MSVSENSRLVHQRSAAAAAGLLLLLALGCAADSHSGAAAAPDLPAVLISELASLNDLPVPQGVDPARFELLKQSLREALLLRGTDKQASAGLGLEVNDLAGADNGDGTYSLAFTYRCRGDYDQNGEVNIADISPLGVYFLATAASANWNQAQVADGDANAEVNIADVTPIAQNYRCVVTGYTVERSATPADPGSWTQIALLPFSAGTIPGGSSLKRFEYTASDHAAGLQYRVSAVWTVTGGGSDYDEVENNDSLETRNALPGGNLSGFSGSSGSGGGYSGYDGDAEDFFGFSAATGEELDISLSLDAGTGDLDLFLYNAAGVEQARSETTASLERIQVSVSGGGDFVLRVFCYSGYSDYSLSLARGGGSGNQAPVAALSGNPLSGSSPLTVSLDAGASTDSDGSIVKYEWDWEDDGSYDFDSGSDPQTQCVYTATPPYTFTARVRVTDNGGLSDTATLQIQIIDPGGFVEPPVESYVDHSQPGDTAAQKWLVSSYAVLPGWQDSDRGFQSETFRQWADSVLSLTNQQRANNGLAPLVWDPHLELVAQAHARDMGLRQFFDHVNPDALSPADRLDAVNTAPWTSRAENIFAGIADPVQDSAQLAVTGWMNSAPHRANILDPGLSSLGVGVYYHTGDPAGYRAYFVQLFCTFSGDPNAHDWIEPQELAGF